MINEDEVFAIRQTKSDSSNGSFLPVEVTPANKFVPIGLEDDGCDEVEVLGDVRLHLDVLRRNTCEEPE